MTRNDETTGMDGNYFTYQVMDFGAHIKTLNRLLQLMPNPEDQNGLSKEIMRIIINCSMPDEWQQELNHAKTSDFFHLLRESTVIKGCGTKNND
jgi:hypothetical protein